MMRGRLIFKFVADIRRLDTEATADVELADGRKGYNNTFRELEKASDPGGGAVGVEVRQEFDPLIIPCQVEPMKWEDTQRVSDGDDVSSMIKLVFHRRWFEQNNMLDSNGLPKLRKGDRLDSIKDRSGNVIQKFGDHPDGVYLYSIMPDSFGLNMRQPKPNLFVALFNNRPKGLGF